MARALVVDDDRLFRMTVGQMLRDAGHDVEVAASGREGIDLGVRWRPDWLVTDWMLKDALHGLHVAGAVQATRPDVVAVLITSFPIEDLRRAASDLGMNAILRKPFAADELLEALRRPPPPRRFGPPGFGVVELDARGRVRWGNPDGERLLGVTQLADLPETAREAWVVVPEHPTSEARLRAPWPDGAQLVIVRERGSRCNDALVEMVLGRHEPGHGTWPRSGRVLVVDDQAMIRVMSSTLLERAGATCYTAATHEAALRYLREDPGIDVVLLDYEMPDGDIGDLIRRARELRPNVLMVGSSGADNRVPFRERGVERYVPKPWRLGELVAAVR